MRDLVITQNITVDGVIEATDDWFSVVGRQSTADLDAALAAQRDASDGFLVGRDTFLAMRDFWGRMTDDPTGTSDHLNQVRKYVVSDTLADAEWSNTEILSGPLDEQIRAIKSVPGSDIVCTGSIRLCRELIGLGLVDEFRLFSCPYARGTGERLFDGTPPQWLELVECRSFSSGAVLTRYRRGTRAPTEAPPTSPDNPALQ